MPKGKELSAEEKAKREAAKAEKFTTLAQKRMTNALNTIALLRGLGNRANYSYTEEQVTKMAEAIQAECQKTFEYFKPDAKADASGGFSF